MISAIANPFLYGYFNETFKDGLQKIFSLCCPQMMRNKNSLHYDKTDIPPLEITLKKHQNGGLASRSNFYQTQSQQYSTQLIKTNKKHFSPSLLIKK
jgi:hypothetical protein